MIPFFSESIMGRSVKYGYSNARTKAMRATLLSKKELDSMIESKNVSEVLAALQKTNYREDLIEKAIEGSGADLIEISLGKNFSRTLKKLIKISPKKDLTKITSLFERYDVLNLKTILLGKHVKEPKEKIKLFLLESPQFDQTSLNRLLELKEVKDVVKFLGGTPYGKTLDKKIKEYEQTGEINVLLQSLESYYFNKFSKAVKGRGAEEKIILALLKEEIDAKNIINILRGKKEELSKEKIREMLIEGGRLSKEKLNKLIEAKSIEAAVSSIKILELKKPLEEFKKDGSLTHFEIAYEKKIARKGLRALRKSILSIGVIVGFLYLKEEEMKNIRKIVRTKEYGVAPEKIKEMMVYAS